MPENQALDIMRKAGVLLEGHFLLTSGRHSNRYLQCARVFRNNHYSEALCSMLARHFSGERIELVVGPALGAVQMAYEMGRQLGCENFFAERENGVMTFRRGFRVEPGRRVLVVEDVVTTGGSVREVMEAVYASGGVVAGVGALVDRTGGTIDFGVPFRAVVSMAVESWEPQGCPLCAQGQLPLVKPGSRSLPR